MPQRVRYFSYEGPVGLFPGLTLWVVLGFGPGVQDLDYTIELLRLDSGILGIFFLRMDFAFSFERDLVFLEPVEQDLDPMVFVKATNRWTQFLTASILYLPLKNLPGPLDLS